jgi:hypothetical protein
VQARWIWIQNTAGILCTCSWPGSWPAALQGILWPGTPPTHPSLSYTIRAQSTYIYRAPQCLSPRRNWDSPFIFCRLYLCSYLTLYRRCELADNYMMSMVSWDPKRRRPGSLSISSLLNIHFGLYLYTYKNVFLMCTYVLMYVPVCWVAQPSPQDEQVEQGTAGNPGRSAGHTAQQLLSSTPLPHAS